jgi:spermidine synthase
VLYACNTIGAAVGVIAASFVGIELLGVRATTIAAAGLNFAVAALGFALARQGTRRPAPAVPATTASAPARTSLAAGTALMALALSGGLALGSEVLWTRTLQLVIGNSTYAFATLLVVYLVGVALGSAAFSGVVKRSRRLESWLVVLLLGMGVWTLLASEGFGLLQGLAAAGDRETVGALLGFYLQTAALLLPLAILSGCMFPAGTRLLEPDADDAGGEQVARAYAWNTIGAVVGSLVAGFVVAARFDFFQAVDLLAAGYALAAMTVGALFLMSGGLGRVAAAAGLLLALGVASYGLAQARDPNRFAQGLEYANPDLEVVFHRPGLQGVTTAIRRRGEPFGSLLLVNGQGMTLKVTDTKLMAHLPMLVHPDPRRVLVICFGMGTTFRSALSYGAEVTAVELVPEVLEAFPVFFADAESVSRDPNGRRVATDGRNFLALTRERFDVITVDPPPPVDAAGVTNLYSREFVALARERLAPGGVFAHWIPFPDGGVEDVHTLRMLLATIAAEFPYVLAVPALNGVGVHVLASDRPIEVDLPAIAERLAAPAVAADLDEWQPVPLEFFSRLGPLDALDFEVVVPRRIRVYGAGLDDVPSVTDDRPRLEFDLWRRARGDRDRH